MYLNKICFQRKIPEPEKTLNEYEKNISMEEWRKCNSMQSKSVLEIDMSVTNSTVDTKVILKDVSCDGIEIEIFIKYLINIRIIYYL